jgi:hypothetical protein
LNIADKRSNIDDRYWHEGQQVRDEAVNARSYVEVFHWTTLKNHSCRPQILVKVVSIRKPGTGIAIG